MISGAVKAGNISVCVWVGGYVGAGEKERGIWVRKAIIKSSFCRHKKTF